MKSFTGIIFWSILLICSACTDENETNNGKRTDCYNGTPLTVRATATGFENVPGSEKPSTRASVTDEHLKTEFVDGDSIGIFSIKDGTIVDDINNIPLVYNLSNDSWSPVENKMQAIRDAALQRLRPILMTSASTVLGLIPLAFATGEGANQRIAMGTAVVGGMLVSTFLTMYIVPAIYSYISTNRNVKTETV